MAPVFDYHKSGLGEYAFIAFAAYGAIVISYYGLKVLTAFLRIFLLTGTNIRKFGPKGSWALITGASDGIGKEFAYQLAAKGFNIILVSRTESKLIQLASEIESKYGVNTKYLAMDFAKVNESDFVHIKELVAGLDLSILINNVGKSHEMPVPFIITDEQELNDIININCFGTLKVTQIVAPGMVERKRGLILTMGSFAGLMPTPLLATYSGSKAFLSHWSTALASELKPKGVRVELINSYLVTSAMSKIRRPTATIPTPKAFVKSTLNRIGVYVGGTSAVVTPYWAHAIMHWALENIVGLGNSLVVSINGTMHEGIRKRALKKKERDAKKL